MCHCPEFLLTVFAVGNGRQDVEAKLRAPQQVLFIGRPTPAVHQIFRNYGGHFSNVHHNGGNLFYTMLLSRFLDVPYNVENNSQLMHLISFY